MATVVVSSSSANRSNSVATNRSISRVFCGIGTAIAIAIANGIGFGFGFVSRTVEFSTAIDAWPSHAGQQGGYRYRCGCGCGCTERVTSSCCTIADLIRIELSFKRVTHCIC